ncbi:hypothetical protein F4553_006911 [Allocatelliglobosispora scoriae]|uniref:Condensation domain-containing protein n=1 Tax=Allocatelliglobosispora scoriae TaxID=643052 RepID=A0A841BWI8_9ACTN|nr:condensation domain-containing protein [Allocatelliglobosispora scoriae]MBB5873477.1 hypothetical protein [Allocatelliglobosispora scoriae]
MSIEAPLSFGQLYSWREIDSYPQDWKQEANLPATWDLRGLTLGQVNAALRVLFLRHEPLRTTYHLRDGEPVHRVHPGVGSPIVHVDRVITDFGDPDRTTVELLSRPFAMTDELCWRGVLVTTDGAPMFLSMSFSHLILDVWSIHRLEAEFRAVIADPRAEEPAAPSPRQLAERQRDESARGRQESADRYWRRILTDELIPALPTLPAGVTRDRIQATLHSHRLSFLTAQAAKLHGVTPPAVLVALVAAGLARYTDSTRVAIGVMSSNRFTPESAKIVGTMNQLIPVVADVDPDVSLAAFVTQLHWAAAKAYRASCYDIDRIAALAAEIGPPAAHDGWFNRLFPCWFNYLQLDGEAPQPRAAAPAEFAWTPVARQFGQPFDVRVTVRGGRTSVALRVDPDLISADGVTSILRMVALGAERAVSSPHATVATVWRADETDLAPSLFPTSLQLAPA